MAMITYAQAINPQGIRFRQESFDPTPVWAVDIQLDLESYPLVEQRITDLQANEPGLTMDAALEQICNEFEHLGPFYYAKTYNLLVSNSGEEFAVQFMSVYNYDHPGTY